MTNQQLKITASFGLLAIAVVHAILLAVALQTPKYVEEWASPSEPELHGPLLTSDQLPTTGVHFDDIPGVAKSAASQSVAPVNELARDEIKRQIFRRRQPVYVQPQNNCPDGRCPNVQPVQPYQPVPIQPTPRPQPQPLPITPTPATKPAAGKCELALFVDGTTKSRQLVQWFTDHKGLASLKAKCAFQAYSPDNALYQSRFAKVVSRDLFPALVFLDSDGGHIHVAGGGNLPNDAETLFQDLKKSYQLKRDMQASTQQPTVDSFDAPIVPVMYQQSEYQDCPDGVCPPERQPLFPLRDRLKKPENMVEGLLRDLAQTGSETAIAVVGLVVVLFLGFLAMNNRNSDPPQQPPTSQGPSQLYV
jgi:hypothetical protein